MSLKVKPRMQNYSVKCCPRCGSIHIYFESYNYSNYPLYFVTCEACSFFSFSVISLQNSIDNWNKYKR